MFHNLIKIYFKYAAEVCILNGRFQEPYYTDFDTSKDGNQFLDCDHIMNQKHWYSLNMVITALL